MKYFILIVLLLVHGCGSEESDSSSVENSFPVEEGLYSRPFFNMEPTYRKIISEGDGVVDFNSFSFDANLAVFQQTNYSSVDGGRLYVLLTNNGWEYRETVLRDRFNLDENNDLIENIFFVPIKYEYAGEEDLSNLNIGTALGEGYSWVSAYNFIDGAKKYLYNRVYTEDVWIIRSEACGPDCFGIISLGGGTLGNWKDKHKSVANPNVEDGFYWLGMSMFFHDSGSVEVYSYFFPERGLISDEGSWEIVTVRGEEILEISITNDVKREFFILAEANPIISKVEQTLFRGIKISSTRNIADDEIQTGYFLNNIANENLKSAFIMEQ